MPTTATAFDLVKDPLGSSRRAVYSGPDRRRNSRVSLQLTLYLASDGAGHPFCTKTKDISRDGFYCVLNQLVKPGRRLECDIALPAHNTQKANDLLYLHCRVVAVRVEELESGVAFGLACRIEDYSVVHTRRTASKPLL